MAQRAGAWNLRYLSQKLALGADEMLASLQSASSSLPEAIEKGVAAYKRSLTSIIVLGGVSMAPTLNRHAEQQPDAVEKLLVRLIPRPSSKSLFTDDVVAFQNPFAASTILDSGDDVEQPQQLMVRRIAAMEGDELIAVDESGVEGEDSEQYIIPQVLFCFLLLFLLPLKKQIENFVFCPPIPETNNLFNLPYHPY